MQIHIFRKTIATILGIIVFEIFYLQFFAILVGAVQLYVEQ